MTSKAKCVLTLSYDHSYVLTVEDAATVFGILSGAAKVRETYDSEGGASHAFTGQPSEVRIVNLRGEPVSEEEYRRISEAREAKWKAEREAREAAKAEAEGNNN